MNGPHPLPYTGLVFGGSSFEGAQSALGRIVLLAAQQGHRLLDEVQRIDSPLPNAFSQLHFSFAGGACASQTVSAGENCVKPHGKNAASSDVHNAHNDVCDSGHPVW